MKLRFSKVRAATLLVGSAATILAAPVGAGIGAGGGTGVLDVDTPEMLPPGWMSFSSSWRLNNVKIDDRRLHTFVASPSVTIGLSGGLEASALLPLNAFYRTDADDDGVETLFDQNFRMRIGDLQLKLKTGVPLGGDRVRLGLEGVASAPTGSDRLEEIYAPGDTLQPFTSGEWNVGGVGLATMDLTGPNGIPMRVHANGGYYWNRDESSFTYRNAHTYALPLPPAEKSEANDLMTLGVAAEFPLFKQAAFVELTTEQFVNARNVIKIRENPILLTPGFRFNLPGGVGLTTAVAFNMSKDDKDTVFDPDEVFPEWEARAVLSLGDIFQSRKSRIERREKQEPPVHAPIFVMPAEEPEAPTAPSVSTAPAKEAVGPPKSAAEAPRKFAPQDDRGMPGDADGDGVPDESDRCPLQKEDLDGFRDSDGCPDLDNDQDGILDLDDLCPNDAEDHRGPRPFDGCPMGSDATSAEVSIVREFVDPALSPGTSPNAARGTAGSGAGASVNSTMTPDAIAAAIRDAATQMNALPATQVAGSAPVDPLRDSDKDGIPDVHDRCPFTPEDLDGFEDLDGCPDLDNDGDGILDKSDRCPNASETWNGYKDEDGCPDTVPGSDAGAAGDASFDLRLLEIERSLNELAARGPAPVVTPGSSTDVFSDVDGDGVSDIYDRCPEIPEDVDGWRDEDGCPDLDNDGDGIKDRDDRCPNSAETWNGFEDEDGCPDEVPMPSASPARVEKAPDPAPAKAAVPEVTERKPARTAPLLQETVFFRTGGSQLPVESLAGLDALAARLRDGAGRIEVLGFSDSMGAVDQNRRLSAARAEAVRTYLISRGVDAARVSTRGMGDSNPIGDNGSAEGRASNRRAEIFLLP